MLIVIFAAGFGAISFLSSGGITLQQAYDNNQVNIIQKTYAGSIPHNVTIKNNGSKSLVIDKGTILKGKDSQDLVIVEDKKINPNTNDTVRAYCIEPDQKAIPGKILTPSGAVSSQIKQIIDNSNPSDLQNATQSQLQIWVIVGKGNVDPYIGEAMAVVQNQKIKYYQLQQKLNTAKTEIMQRFNITQEAIQSIPTTSDSNNSANTWGSDLRQWIKINFGI
jgi:hypothetical protein